jgi:selenide,water dikinase
VLSDIPAYANDRVLLDFRTADDAGVYLWDGSALVQTVDFFTPIVDDPYTYGQIAAANSLSDVYAMGGRPLTALAISAFPSHGLEHDAIRSIFRGGLDKLREAGVALLGGHTVQDQEIKFGYAITGSIDPKRIFRKAGAAPGDALILTKPLGTGIVGTAIKFDRAPRGLVDQAVRSMTTLNHAAAAVLQALPEGAVHACTDVTGFGLAGHATEVARASGVTIELDADRLPVFEGVVEVAAANRSGGMQANLDYFEAGVRCPSSRSSKRLEIQAVRYLIYDPQTSGGLLIAVSKQFETALEEAYRAAGTAFWRIGRVVEAVPEIHVDVV